jgi:hypothetical protein
MTITPEQAEVIADAIESALIDVHVSLPGKVEKYDAATQTANVQLQVKRMLPDSAGSYSSESLPVLQNIPVQFPRTSGAVLALPVAVGDTWRVVFSEMSLDQWRSKGVETSPGDVGRHTLSGGVFQPGLVPNSEAITDDDIADDVVLGFIGGAQLRAKPGGTIEAVAGGIGGQSADEFVVVFDQLVTQLTAAASAAVAAAVAGDGGKAAFGAFSTYVNGVVFPLAASANLKADNSVP